MTRRVIAAFLLCAGCEGPQGPAGFVPDPTPIPASAVLFSNSASGLSAAQVQGAIDELAIRNGLAVPVMCGTASSAVGADFNGWNLAAAACNAACTSTAARPCSADDVIHVVQTGGSIPAVGWVFSGMGCLALDSASTSDTGSLWNGTTFETRPCDTSTTLLCCR